VLIVDELLVEPFQEELLGVLGALTGAGAGVEGF
jgi:hypothetical protein